MGTRWWALHILIITLLCQWNLSEGHELREDGEVMGAGEKV